MGRMILSVWGKNPRLESECLIARNTSAVCKLWDTGKSPGVSEPQSLHLHNGKDIITSIPIYMVVLWGLNKVSEIIFKFTMMAGAGSSQVSHTMGMSSFRTVVQCDYTVLLLVMWWHQVLSALGVLAQSVSWISVRTHSYGMAVIGQTLS